MTKQYLYVKIYQDITEKIENDLLKPGEKLPTEAELCHSYGVSRDTVRKALSRLEHDGLIDRTAALGTFVKSRKKDYPLTRVESFTHQMKKIGADPSSEILLIQLLDEVDYEIKKVLKLDSGEKCYKLCRIRKANDVPMSFETSFIRHKYCPDLLKFLDDHASIYEILSVTYGLPLAYENISLEAEMPSAEVAKYLSISTESPTLKMKCNLIMQEDVPVYYVECYYIGDKYVFTTSIKW